MPIDDDYDDEDLNNANEVEDDVEEEAEDDAEGQRDGQDGDASYAKGKDEGDEERQTRSLGRRERTVLAAKEEARKAREEAAETRRQLEEFRTQQQQQAYRPDPALERQRLELMSPEERMSYQLQQAEQRNQQQLQQMQFQMWDSNDKVAFKTLATTDKTAARLSDKVEAELSILRSRGQNVDRQTLLYYLAGKEAVERGRVAGTKQRQTGADNIRRQSARPGNSQSNVSADRRGGKSVEDRLADVFI